MASNDPASAAARYQADKRHAQDLWARSANLANRLADAEEGVAATMTHLARRHPEQAERLQALSDRALDSAARARRTANDHAQA